MSGGRFVLIFSILGHFADRSWATDDQNTYDRLMRERASREESFSSCQVNTALVGEWKSLRSKAPNLNQDL